MLADLSQHCGVGAHRHAAPRPHQPFPCFALRGSRLERSNNLSSRHSSIVSGSSIKLFEGGEKLRADRAIDGAVIAGQCAAHHGGNRRARRLDDRTLFAGADRQDAAMRRVDHRGEFADPEHAEVGDREGAALKFFELQLAGAGAGGEILGLAGDLSPGPCDRPA